MSMQKLLKSTALAALIAGTAFVPAAQAKGCLKGAAVGASRDMSQATTGLSERPLGVPLEVTAQR